MSTKNRSVVVTIPRSTLPHPMFHRSWGKKCDVSGYWENKYEWQLKIVPSTDPVRLRYRPLGYKGEGEIFHFVYSCKSSSFMELEDFVVGEYHPKRWHQPTMPWLLLMEEVDSAEDRHLPDSATLYATPCGAAWLAWRMMVENDPEPPLFCDPPEEVTSLEDAPFDVYLERLDESDCPPMTKLRYAVWLKLVFGLHPFPSPRPAA